MKKKFIIGMTVFSPDNEWPEERSPLEEDFDLATVIEEESAVKEAVLNLNKIYQTKFYDYYDRNPGNNCHDNYMEFWYIEPETPELMQIDNDFCAKIYKKVMKDYDGLHTWCLE